jgi:hypothetical protein
MATRIKKATKASKSKATKASKKSSSKKASKKKAPAKKKAVKAATKKAAKKKVAAKKSSRKVLSAKKKSTKKTPAKKVATKRATKSSSSESTSTKTAKRSTTKRTAAQLPTQEAIASTNGAMRTATEVAGTPRPVFKVLAQREEGLQSIFARGLLRGTFSTEHFTLAPDGSPFTAFNYKQDAERFVSMNQKNRKEGWSPWIIVKGVGVMAPHTPRRVPKIHDFNPTTAEELQATTEAIIRVGTMRYKKKRRHSSHTPNNPNKRWTKGTVFVSSFKITQPSV